MSGDGCRLTLHVLDVARGQPAAGLAVALVRVDGDDLGALGRATTDADGRVDGVAEGWPALAPGSHELRYDLGDHFGGMTPPVPTLYDEVPVRFVVRDDDTHLHLALLVSPWSYTTYRGS